MKFLATIFISIASLFGIDLKEVPQPTPVVSVAPEITPTPIIKTPTITTAKTPSPTISKTPLPTLIKTPTPTPDLSAVDRYIEQLIAQRQQQILQQQSQQNLIKSQLQDINNQITAIKTQYYTDVEKVNSNSWLTEPIRIAEINKLTTAANFKISQLSTQYNSLLSQAGVYVAPQPINTSYSTGSTVWRIESDLNGLSGKIYGDNGSSYRWDCVNPYSCTMY